VDFASRFFASETAPAAPGNHAQSRAGGAGGQPAEEQGTRVSARALREILDANPSGELTLLLLYEEACPGRRARRLQALGKLAPRIVFTSTGRCGLRSSPTPRGSRTRKTSAISCPAPSCACWNSAGPEPVMRTLLGDPTGAIRDPAGVVGRAGSAVRVEKIA